MNEIESHSRYILYHLIERESMRKKISPIFVLNFRMYIILHWTFTYMLAHSHDYGITRFLCKCACMILDVSAYDLASHQTWPMRKHLFVYMCSIEHIMYTKIQYTYTLAIYSFSCFLSLPNGSLTKNIIQYFKFSLIFCEVLKFQLIITLLPKIKRWIDIEMYHAKSMNGFYSANRHNR